MSTEEYVTIDVARQFSAYPSGRFPTDGDYNGERFRDELLAPALQKVVESGGGKVLVDIDGVRSFGSSFLEEAFAGLVRLGKFDRKTVRRFVEIICTKEHLSFYKSSIENLIAEAIPDPATA